MTDRTLKFMEYGCYILGVIILLLALTSCGATDRGNVVREFALAKGAEVADQTLKNSETYMCRIAPVASIARRYGSDPELVKCYVRICNPNANAIEELITRSEVPENE